MLLIVPFSAPPRLLTGAILTHTLLAGALLAGMLVSSVAHAQDSDYELDRRPAADSAKAAWFVRPGERFDIVFNTGYLLGGASADSAPTNGLSGTTFLGFSFNWVVNRRFALKAQPGVAFYKLNFDQTPAKRFPTPPDSGVTSEKLRAFYIEVPLGVAIAIKRDEQDRLRTWAELGATVGYRFDSSLKLAGTDANGDAFKLRTDGIRGFARWRVGLYGKVAYKLFGFWAFYRLTDVFEPGAGYDPVQGVRRAGPARFVEPPRFEFGVTLVL